MVTKFDHNLVMDGKPSTKVTLQLLGRCISMKWNFRQELICSLAAYVLFPK